MAAKKTNSSQPIDSPERRRLPPLLRRAWYGLNQAFRRRLAHLELTPDQFTVLRTLIEQEGITQSQLAVTMTSDPNTVASLVNRMEKAGLLDRDTHDGDRRANRLRVSRKGNARYQRAREVAVVLQGEVLAVLPESEREEFLTQLTALADACRNAAEKPC
jgi:DNA-binding MarR family transcriptional regulator